MPVTNLTLRPTRPLWPAMLNGMKCRCPNCGKGKLFSRYLKIADQCDVCGTELFHHRADDAPPYLVITIVGHLAVGAVLHMEMSSTPLHPLTYLWIMIPMILISSVLLLPVIKGAIVGLQWARYMHGFDPAGTHDEIESDGHA
ncbi:DUF983 domain-containing protein [Pelagibacterium sp. H642]|uniref:DUF983 domain-containing protein n=1 Tax=Pelagibacterium sp. H642 TaxID=1881069 RepID=UPI0028166756|nr:DUF983 domain-containing protein [Pelagibacterium sp. H642]WMT90340.1 DUF983 domain-containing protein [Pelagibacterium sp. H642]